MKTRRQHSSDSIDQVIRQHMDLPLDYGRVHEALDLDAIALRGQNQAAHRVTVPISSGYRLLPIVTAMAATFLVVVGLTGAGLWIADRHDDLHRPLPPIDGTSETADISEPADATDSWVSAEPDTKLVFDTGASSETLTMTETDEAVTIGGHAATGHHVNKTNPDEYAANHVRLFGVLYCRTTNKVSSAVLADQLTSKPRCYAIEGLDPNRYIAVEENGRYYLYMASDDDVN